VLIIRRSNCINTASGIVFSVRDRPVCRLRRNSKGLGGGDCFSTLEFMHCSCAKER